MDLLISSLSVQCHKHLWWVPDAVTDTGHWPVGRPSPVRGLLSCHLHYISKEGRAKSSRVRAKPASISPSMHHSAPSAPHPLMLLN